MAALLVLAISAPLKRETPLVVFSYAVTILGRISHALADEVDQTSLLTYLSQCSQCTGDSLSAFATEVTLPILVKSDLRDLEGSRSNEYQQQINNHLLKCVNSILVKVRATWPLIKSGSRSEALRMLR